MSRSLKSKILSQVIGLYNSGYSGTELVDLLGQAFPGESRGTLAIFAALVDAGAERADAYRAGRPLGMPPDLPPPAPPGTRGGWIMTCHVIVVSGSSVREWNEATGILPGTDPATAHAEIMAKVQAIIGGENAKPGFAANMWEIQSVECTLVLPRLE